MNKKDHKLSNLGVPGYLGFHSSSIVMQQISLDSSSQTTAFLALTGAVSDSELAKPFGLSLNES